MRQKTRNQMTQKQLDELFIESAAHKICQQELGIQLVCGVKTGHHFSVKRKYQNGDVLFRCIKCDLEYIKSNCDLSEKEKELVKAVLGDGK